MTAPLTWAFVIDSVPFTRAVVDGKTSLGGSESACLGLARALVARGETVHIFTSKMHDDAMGRDPWGCVWHPVDEFVPMNEFIEWDVVVALRWFAFFGAQPIQARLKMLWNQDLMVPGSMQLGVMSVAWAFDQLAYVSQYHRDQWEDLQPELKPVGWTSRNGIDLGQVPTGVVKDPNRVIHISRPERGLRPLLKLWPLLREKHPQATLRICRYSSMYDTGPGSWSEECAKYDALVQQVNEQVGGITYLGELNKIQLYQEISEAAVMWYPGVANFAETNCIAATEANACGTPFVGSLKGALVETAKPSYDAGLLMAGDADADEVYAEASVAAVKNLLEGCAKNSFAYRALTRQQKQHAATYGYDTLAAEWLEHVHGTFTTRYETHKPAILQQLLHDDDHVAALIVAKELGDEQAIARCEGVIHGKYSGPDDYSKTAVQDPIYEADVCTRFQNVGQLLKGCTRVLDVACGNGSFAIALARMYPDVHIHALDYSPDNIAHARAAVEQLGFSDRITFEQRTIYDFDTQAMHADWTAFAAAVADSGLVFDGLFVGEFIEHVADCTMLVDALEQLVSPWAAVVYSCPSGAFVDLCDRLVPYKYTHVHRFHSDDIKAVFGAKRNLQSDYLSMGWSRRGAPVGAWVISYQAEPGRVAGRRPLQQRIHKARPMPKVSVGMIVKDAELDLARCLASIWPIADEIVVGDTGSRDKTREIAKEYGARVLELEPIDKQPEGFAGARNAVMQACTGDWFLWIDADEILIGSSALRRYLDGHIFRGFVLHQNHLQLDAPRHHDIPVRVFKRGPDIQFYGCVHEQPQQGDANGDIYPTLDIEDAQLAHTGYLTEGIRRQKMLLRNMPLIMKDQRVFPQRDLGKVILLRESVLQANRDRERVGGEMTERAQHGYLFALRLFHDHFIDPANKYHTLARPWYEMALQAMGLGWEVELALAGRKGGMKDRHAKPERIWVADEAEFSRIAAHRAAEIVKKMQPTVFHTDPFVVPSSEAVSA